MLIPEEEVVSKYEAQVQRGIDGKNIGLELDKGQYGRLTKYIANIQQGRFDLIGAPTGCGKSTLALDMYMVNPIRYVEANPQKNIALKVLYFNMELPVQNVVAKYVARRIYELSGGNTRLSVNKIFQKGEMIAPELQIEVAKHKDEFKSLLKYVNFYEGSITGKYMYKEIMRVLGELGTFTEMTNPDGSTYKTHKYHNPNTYLICVADHIGLLRPNKGELDTVKTAIDNTINNCVIPTRNKYGVTWAMCQQMNRANEDPNRMKSAVGSEPLLSDFMYSSIPAQGADTVIGLYRPQWFKLDRYAGYEIKEVQNYFLTAKLLKNRDGHMNRIIPFGFLGSVGYIKELPFPNEIGIHPYPDYQQLKHFFRE